MNNAKIFTVLMVISETDNENFLERALKSITIDQTFLANEYVIIRNGHLSAKKENANRYIYAIFKSKIYR